MEQIEKPKYRKFPISRVKTFEIVSWLNKFRPKMQLNVKKGKNA
jgi:hypothetical protein